MNDFTFSNQDSDEINRAKNATLPKRCSLFDRNHQKIGKIKDHTLFDMKGNKVGTFIRTSSYVFFAYEKDDKPCGYLNEKNEIVTFDGEHIGSIFKRVIPFALYFPLTMLLLVSTATHAVFPFVQTVNFIHTIAVIDESGVTWQFETEIDIFGNVREKGKEIAPGSSGQYAFKIENQAKRTAKYSFTFQTLAGESIPMAYKLLDENGYVYGGQNEYFYADNERKSEMQLDASSLKEYVLEWTWLDTEVGATPDYYSIKIIIDYTFVNEET